MNTKLLEVFNYLDKEIEFDGVVKDKLALEAIVNKAFLQENLSFYSDSESNTKSNSNIDFRLDSNNSDFNDKKIDDKSDDKDPDDKDILQYPHNNSRISNCNSGYT